MGNIAGYWVDLDNVKLDDHADGSHTSWIQGMTIGKFKHPMYGEIDITLDRVRRFAQSVTDKVRGTELDIDYDHKEKSGEAAGWVKQAEARSDGLWLLVEWTQDAATKIKNKAYKYFSPEFADEWTHPKTQVSYKDVLFGGGITNRPFLKDIQPINMSEVFPSDSPTGGQMDPKKLRELLGLPEDAADELVNTTLTQKLSEGGAEKPKGAPDDAHTMSEMADQIKKLSETNPAVKALAEQLEETRKQLAETSVAVRLSEVNNQVVALSEVAKTKLNATVPPAVSDALKALLIKVPRALGEEVLGIVVKLAEVGFVSLGEIGKSEQHAEDDNTSDAEKRFNDEVVKMQAANKDLSYADTVERVASEQPMLFKEYQNAAYAFRI